MATILVIEDTLTQAEIMTGALRQAGFSTIAVTSSEDAKLKIDQQKPDAIVLDVVLPGASGFEFCRELKGNPNTRSIPVIMCSTKDGEMDRFWGIKQGADSYLTKPINTEELVRTVKLMVSAV
ncbi:MAG: response regulator [Oculatellaceae cyanobacterium Prado106]|jgi:DNA-binding response OmpR family regulator|nr:response regulator [Oculatellaceae cyanobacterium Prado106]